MTESITADRDSRRRWIALVVVCLAMLMNVLDTTVVNVALPKIQADLHFTQAGLAWVLDAYLVAFGGFLLMSGRLGDLIGRKKVFLAGLALFTLASMVCGVANSQGLLIGARFVQGMSGAMSSSVILAIIATEFPEPQERAQAMSAYIFVAVGGGSVGLLAGGAITQALNWHWIFFINLPIGLVAFVLGVMLVKENVGIGLRQGIDVLGSVLVTGGLMLGVYAVVKSTQYGLGSAHTLGFGGLAIAMIAGFIVLEGRLKNPIMPLRILRVRGLLSSSFVRGFLFIGMYGCFFVGTLYLEHVLRYGALTTGLAFLPMTLVVATLSMGITAKLVGRFGPKQVLLPAVVSVVAGLALLSQAGIHQQYFPLLFAAFLLMPRRRTRVGDRQRVDAGFRRAWCRSSRHDLHRPNEDAHQARSPARQRTHRRLPPRVYDRGNLRPRCTAVRGARAASAEQARNRGRACAKRYCRGRIRLSERGSRLRSGCSRSSSQPNERAW
jgi:EmrB/QacA subfamily drug resistance transporter